MKRIGKYLSIAFGVFVLLIVAGYIYLRLPPNDGRTLAERRQIADACFAMLHSSLTNEDDIKPNDPRIPEVIRDLHPVGVLVTSDFSVQIDFTTKPGEYFLMRLPSHTNTWVLCAAGVGIPFGPREVLRIEHD
mgnify:FL=1